jgi:hypothetical protein
MIYFVITITSLLLGYYLGSKRSPKKDAIAIVKQSKELIAKDELKVGPIKRPSAKELSLRNEDPRVIAEKKALLDSLEQSDLKQLKETVEELKRKGIDVST